MATVYNNSRVGFAQDNKYQVEERKKYLTAKYGAHQMRLIRKRLAVEDWLDKELKALYQVGDGDYDTEIDLDEILDLDELIEKQKYIEQRVSNCKQSQEVIMNFIKAVIEKSETL